MDPGKSGENYVGGDGSSAALAAKYSSNIPTDQTISQGGATGQSKPCQSSVDIATLVVDGAWVCSLLGKEA